MTRNEQYYQQLLDKWVKSEISPDEATELMNYLQEDGSNRPLLQKMKEDFKGSADLDAAVDPAMSERIRKELLKNIQQPPVIDIRERRNKFNPLSVAAAFLVLVGLGLVLRFTLFNNDPQKQPLSGEKPAVEQQSDIAAGRYKALLTLANGEKIVLDSASAGQLASQGNTTIINKNGHLVYNPDKASPDEVIYNTLSTARGESYQLILADGSKVWLNASSSIRFPASFVTNERSVEISGEAYFEIAKDKSKPFRVKVNDMTVEVLGTHFDINSYGDEATINTTLIEGSVKVSKGNKTLLLAPGHQSQLQPNGNLNLVKNVNLDEVIAWKEGNFHFESADISSILRQFARWYDVEIVIEGKLKPRKFFGIVSRSSSLASVLTMLKANDVHFRIEGKKLIVQSG